MDECSFCDAPTNKVAGCTAVALHRDGEHVALIPFGDEYPPFDGVRCPGCRALRGAHHHIDCTLQQCPECDWLLLACDCFRIETDAFLVCQGQCPDSDWADPFADAVPFGVDGNGIMTERVTIDGQEVILRREDYPASDLTEVDGIRCTTALRTLIDIAVDLPDDDMQLNVTDCLLRGLFTLDEAWRRLGEPDMRDYPGAAVMRRVLPPAA